MVLTSQKESRFHHVKLAYEVPSCKTSSHCVFTMSYSRCLIA